MKFKMAYYQAETKFRLKKVKTDLTSALNTLDFFKIFIPLMFGLVVLLFLVLFLAGLILSILGRLEGSLPGVAWTFAKAQLTGQNSVRLFGTLMAYLGAMIIRGLMKSRIQKFGDSVRVKKSIIYVFGTSIYAETFIKEMIKLGFSDRVALVAERGLIWVEEVSTQCDTLIEENLEEFEKTNLYDIIGFENAAKILVLTEDPTMNQNIITYTRERNKTVEIVVLARFAPSFIRTLQAYVEGIQIIDDIGAITQDLVQSLSLEITFAPTFWVPTPKSYIGEMGNAITADILGVEVLKINREGQLLDPDALISSGDKLLLYVHDEKTLRTLTRIITQE
ncbi:MAG: hypothetical protein ACE5I5_15995 [Candidatus Heimdallarchaeota archaeon]